MPSYATTSNTNDPSYWSAKYAAICIKYEPEQTSPYGHLNAAKTGIVADVNLLALIVKGGSVDGGNAVYENTVIGQTYLAPLNNGGQQSAVSHWIACLNNSTTTTTNTSTSSTSTTSSSTSSTSSSSTTTTVPKTTSTTALVTTTTVPKSTTTSTSVTSSTSTTVPEPEIIDAVVQSRSTEELPNTGFNSWILVAIGSALIIFGSVLIKK